MVLFFEVHLVEAQPSRVGTVEAIATTTREGGVIIVAMVVTTINERLTRPICGHT